MTMRFEKTKQLYREKGLWAVIRGWANVFYYVFYYKVLTWNACDYITFLYYKIFKGLRSFRLDGKSYRYFYHLYNTTWKNERAVEIPFILSILRRYQGRDILEVGNVLSNYFKITHDVLDKNDKGPHIIHLDAIDFRPEKKYDLIISISTIEHVGYNEGPSGKDFSERPDPLKILRVLDILKNSLTETGEMVVSIPMGFNRELDKLVRSRKIGFEKTLCLRNISGRNLWEEADIGQLSEQDCSYGPYANVLVIGYIKK
jgi:hypothetical protein